MWVNVMPVAASEVKIVASDVLNCSDVLQPAH